MTGPGDDDRDLIELGTTGDDAKRSISGTGGKDHAKYHSIAESHEGCSCGGAVIGSLLAALPMTGANAAETDSSNDALCSENSATMRQEYLAAHDLPPDSTLYAACTNGTPTVWALDDSGEPLPLSTSEQGSASQPQEGVAPQDIEEFSCLIADVWEVTCTWGTTYQKYSGETLVWERHISASGRLDLQQKSHKVTLRFTNDSGVQMSTRGRVILQRQQGVLPSTFENDAAFDFNSAPFTQAGGTVWVDRLTTDIGKYSVIFNLEFVHDHQENVDIPIIGDPTSPRFQCFEESAEKNCEYPDGQEAGVF